VKSDVMTSFVHLHIPPPPGSAESRTMVLLHGTGGNERDLVELATSIAPGARLLGVRGRVLENGMPRFFRRLAEGVFDEADLVQRAGELADFIVKAAASYGFDARQVMAIGYSNGANIAAAIMMLHPTALSGGVLFRSMVPLVLESLPTLRGASVLLAEGQLDPIVPRENAVRLAAMFRDAGADVTLHWEPAGHALTNGDVAAARIWMAGLPKP
jgi:phospholipase/carboxylesterase